MPGPGVNAAYGGLRMWRFLLRLPQKQNRSQNPVNKSQKESVARRTYQKPHRASNVPHSASGESRVASWFCSGPSSCTLYQTPTSCQQTQCYRRPPTAMSRAKAFKRCWSRCTNLYLVAQTGKGNSPLDASRPLVY